MGPRLDVGEMSMQAGGWVAWEMVGSGEDAEIVVYEN